MSAGKPMSFWLLVCLFVHALDTCWKTQKFNSDFCSGKPSLLDPETKLLVSRIWVLLHEDLAVTGSVLGGLGLSVFQKPWISQPHCPLQSFQGIPRICTDNILQIKRTTSSIVSYIWKPCGPCQATLRVKCRQCNARISGDYVRGAPEWNERMGPGEAGSHQQCFISLCAERLANILYERVTGRHYKHCLSLE